MKLLGGAALAAGGLLVAIVACGRSASRDVILVTIDTLRADRLGCYGNSGRFTPTLDAIASAGALFEHASATMPLTLPSHASLLTGRYTDATGVRNNGSFVLPRSETTLAEVLRGAGWVTGAVVGAFPLNSRYGLSQGFDVYDEELPPPKARIAGGLPIFFSERNARAVTDRALEIWNAFSKRPRFLWVHYFDPHAPYSPPEPFAGRHLAQPYDGEVEFVDSELGRLLARIRASSPRAILVVAADHGESLGEHGEKTHGVFLYESTLHVPLLIEAPGLLPAGRRIAAPVSLVDVMPTILGLLGIRPPAAVQGRDLGRAVVSGSAESEAIYAESELPRLQFRFSDLTMLRRGSLKYIDAPSPELFDLASDPAEARNLHGSHPGESALAEELARRVSSADPKVSTQASLGVDSESEARLRSLGYASAGSLERAPGEGRGRDPKTMTDYLRRYDLAIGHFADGEIAKGIAEIRGLLPEAPENYMARYQIAGGLYAMKRLEEAEEEARRVVAAAPGFTPGVLLLAQVEGDLGKVDDAIRDFKTAAATAPWLAEPHAALGKLLESIGRYDEAVSAYEEAVRVEPSSTTGPRSLLDLRLERGEPRLAVLDFQRLTERYPDSAPLWTCLAVALRKTGDRAGAAKSLKRSLTLAPWRAPALSQLGELLLDSNAPDRAEGAFRQALQREPDLANARFGLARALLLQGKTSEADAEFSIVLKTYPGLSAAYTLRGRYFEQHGDRRTATDFYRRAMDVNPADREAWEGLNRLGVGR